MTALRSRLADGGPYGFLGEEVLTETVALFTETTEAQDIVETSHLVGLALWHRAMAAADERTVGDLRTAGVLLQLVRNSGAALPVPQALLERLGERQPLDGPPSSASWDDLLAALGTRLANGCDAHTARLTISAARNATATASRPDMLEHRRGILATALYILSEHTGDPAAREEALALGHRGTLTVPEDLHEALSADIDDPLLLSEALGVAGLVVRVMANPREASTDQLERAATMLRRQYAQTGDARAAHFGIAALRRALGASWPGTQRHRLCRHHLAILLQETARHTGDPRALDEASDTMAALVRETPDDDPEAAEHYATLVSLLNDRYERTADPALLDEAVTAGRVGLALLPSGAPTRWAHLTNLAVSLKRTAEADPGRAPDLDLLREAVDLQRQAVAASLAGPVSSSIRAGLLANLTSSLGALYDRTGDPAPLAEAIRVGRRAVAEIRQDDGSRSRIEANLASALSAHGLGTGDREAVAEALGLLETAVARETAPTPDRVEMARQGGELAMTAGLPVRAARIFALGVALLPRLAARGLGRRDAAGQLVAYARLTADAAACALIAGRPSSTAAELLETGRGVLAAQALESRSDLTLLHERDPDLADRFELLCARLDGDPEPGPEDEMDAHEDAPDLRRRLAHELETVLRRIRDLPGLDNFLRPARADELVAEAHDGPIVMVNVSRYRSDALLLTGAGVQVCELPGVSYEELHTRLAALHEHLGSLSSSGYARLAVERAVAGEILPWLWDQLAGPVLDRLGLTGPVHDREPARLWWIPCGPLAFFPLHAAGHHHDDPTRGPRRTVLDRVVSSYTPTVRALAHARTQRARQDRSRRLPARRGEPPHLLAIAMPQTPGETELPAALAENRYLSTLFPSAHPLVGPQATRDSVLAALAATPWAHFACHADTDSEDPSRSRLLVHDHLSKPLTVLEISRLRLEKSEFAYLSACNTAVTTPELADEAIHVVSAFQLAGFPHVVGTLWQVDDTVAAEIAIHFYGQFPGAAFDADRTALQLHRTTRAFRDRFPRFPTLWSAHIHMGA
ncbi:CHAT domain-containing protein [Streptomyces sp. NPDC048383]|uniref:CHAT domain-containing protein n=1 Tax=Streptomyces sp. NPDC048383 TaxID=3155386 RepID=UPI0034258375